MKNEQQYEREKRENKKKYYRFYQRGKILMTIARSELEDGKLNLIQCTSVRTDLSCVVLIYNKAYSKVDL